MSDESAELYRSSGFVAGRTTAPPFARSTSRLAAPASIRAATLEETQAAIRAAWGRDTSDDPEEWSEENRARGQCAVTALLVRELFGGEILVANVLRDGRRVDRHAWNRLPSGLTLDLTREQFVNGEQFGSGCTEEPLLTHRNPERFATLRARVRPASSWTERYLRGFGLDAIVQPLFEVAAQILSGRAEGIARTARLESHDANLLVTRAVAARIALGFRQWTHTHAAHCMSTFGRNDRPRESASVAFVA